MTFCKAYNMELSYTLRNIIAHSTVYLHLSHMQAVFILTTGLLAEVIYINFILHTSHTYAGFSAVYIEI